MRNLNGLLQYTNCGIYCAQAGMYIDPWRPVDKAIITHAHSDHARFGSRFYLAHRITSPILKYRLGSEISVEEVEYGKSIFQNGVKISFHPSGHIPGSAQIRLEHKGEVAVVSGDYKLQDDHLTETFEPLKCNVFVSESTFGLPIYKWKSQEEIFADINQWWRRNKEKGKASVLCGYSLGKAQRILYNVDNSIGKIFAHGSIANINELLISAGLRLPATIRADRKFSKKDYSESLILAPPSAMGSPWLRTFEPYSLGYASGWMNVRGAKRRQALDIGFALSDHADWNDLNRAIVETEAEKIFVTHGFTASFVRWLRDKGIDAYELETEYAGETE